MVYKKPRKRYRLPKKAAELQNKKPVESLEKVSPNLNDNISVAEHTFKDSLDFIVRKVRFGPSGQVRMALVFLETLTDKQTLSDYVLEPLNFLCFEEYEVTQIPGKIIDILPSALKIEEDADWALLVKKIVTGHALLFIDGYDRAVIMEARKWKERAISEPQTETSVVGPREGFVESLITNASLLRRRLRTPNLVLEAIPVGTTSNTNVALCYLKGVADEKLVQKVRQRVESINVEAMYSVNLVSELLADVRYTPFRLFATTERPDKLASALVEGRVGIMAENTPMAMIVPSVFWQFFQSSEDYYEHYPLAAVNRALRMAAFFIVVGLTAAYVAVATFHQEMIPTPLLLAMAAVREPVPLPTVLEALMLEIILEGLREAGLRLPKPAGQAVSIVGALVMGQAAVTAGLVSPQMVIVVGLGAVASFLIPDYSFVNALRILKLLFIILAGAFGAFGLMMGYMVLGIHLTSLQSFGVPYTAPVTPFSLKDMKDVFFRAPWWAMGKQGPKKRGDDNEKKN
ncbi:MAG TPA: spore germination protein [Firmicutes bacterium]|nr:spore germination protein [Bacillota bacterium]